MTYNLLQRLCAAPLFEEINAIVMRATSRGCTAANCNTRALPGVAALTARRQSAPSPFR